MGVTRRGIQVVHNLENDQLEHRAAKGEIHAEDKLQLKVIKILLENALYVSKYVSLEKF